MPIVAVPQALADDLRMDALREHQGCVRMPKVMETNAWQPAPP
jgi:hypothetical protein